MSDETWWIMRAGVKLGELRNGKMDPQSEFWTEYQLIVEDQSFDKIKDDVESWNDLDLTLQASENPDLRIPNFLVAKRKQGKVAIRYIC